MNKKMLGMGAVALVAAILVAASTISTNDAFAKRSSQSNAQAAANDCPSNAVNTPSQSGSGGGANQEDSGNTDCIILQLQESDGLAIALH
jgi:hypothetical protein